MFVWVSHFLPPARGMGLDPFFGAKAGGGGVDPHFFRAQSARNMGVAAPKKPLKKYFWGVLKKLSNKNAIKFGF